MLSLRIPNFTGQMVSIILRTRLHLPSLYPTSLGPIKKSLPAHITQLHAKLLDALGSLGVPRNGESVGVSDL